MQAKPPGAFARKNSGLDAFLYADIGAELNGLPLTILSVLARLGEDPWTQAASWAALPTAAAIEALSQSIGQMPLAPGTLAGRRDIAARLVQLLPGKSRHVVPEPARNARLAAATPELAPLIITWCALAVGMALSALLVPKSPTDVVASIERPTVIAGSIASSPAPLAHSAAATPPVAPVRP